MSIFQEPLFASGKGVDWIEGEVVSRRGRELIATPLEASLARAEGMRRPFFDMEQRPHSARLRELGVAIDPDAFGGDRIAMARILVAKDGGSVRTFSGNLNHVTGWWPSAKARRLLHFEGTAARSLLVLHECEPSTIRMLTEPMTFDVRTAGEAFSYTPDLLIERADGVRVVVEAKSRETDLHDVEYRTKLGIVAEICRRLGWMFQIILEDEVFLNRTHMNNCSLVASRRFVRVDEVHRARLSRLRGESTTYGQLAEALDPGSPLVGKAVAQAMHVRRLVHIDLSHWLQDLTKVQLIDPKHSPQGSSHDGLRPDETAFPRPAYAYA
jgi:hypothetical protein